MYDNPNNLVTERLRKRDELLLTGVDPYPVAAYAPSHTASEIRRNAQAMASAGHRPRHASRRRHRSRRRSDRHDPHGRRDHSRRNVLPLGHPPPQRH